MSVDLKTHLALSKSRTTDTSGARLCRATANGDWVQAGVGLYWSVGSAATLNGLTFAGNVLAQDLISSDGNLTINCGRLLSSEAQVTLIQDNISTGCAGTGLGSGGFDQGVDIGSGGIGEPVRHAVPEPGTFLLLGIGLMGLFTLRKNSSTRA